jgi:hypothetical protein
LASIVANIDIITACGEIYTGLLADGDVIVLYIVSERAHSYSCVGASGFINR